MKRLAFVLLAGIVLSACSNYTLEKAKERGDVVEGPGGPLNVEQLDEFAQKGKLAGNLRIIRFDDEGRPDIADLSSGDEGIRYQYDPHDGRKSETLCKGGARRNNPLPA
ncbi:hypothetical protein [Paenibacillus methanolicus]|uniref:Uncharacterized protein n=1 Tax=Paenibacillus methanolicus TaxID=582686 RepID=A0A5S5BQV2_9BACL|nr:hypothetical protein [Paenibacillus methanolicus]TYP69377.1 hypothetical protein BCM02_11537 [Paenibacillus methanolicus]